MAVEAHEHGRQGSREWSSRLARKAVKARAYGRQGSRAWLSRLARPAQARTPLVPHGSPLPLIARPHERALMSRTRGFSAAPPPLLRRGVVTLRSRGEPTLRGELGGLLCSGEGGERAAVIETPPRATRSESGRVGWRAMRMAPKRDPSSRQGGERGRQEGRRVVRRREDRIDAADTYVHCWLDASGGADAADASPWR